MKESISMLENGFYSSSGLTPEFAEFYRIFKSEFTRELKTIGATNIKFNRGHFYVSGFFTVNGQPYYFSLPDVRGSEYKMPQLMYREVEDYKDFTGKLNRYVDIKPLMADEMCWYFKIV